MNKTEEGAAKQSLQIEEDILKLLYDSRKIIIYYGENKMK